MAVFSKHEDVDKFGNKVSIIGLNSGRKLRMVHFPVQARGTSYRWVSNIYRRKGMYAQVVETSNDNDCVPSTLDVAGYQLMWGDGELLASTENPAGPIILTHIRRSLQHESEDTTRSVILAVLEEIQGLDHLWTIKG